MTLELPVLRLGLAGFSAEQQDAVRAVVGGVVAFGASWEVSSFADADAWWISGQRTQLLPDGTLRVGPGTPSGRSLQLNLADVDRPVAFARPLPGAGFSPAYAFDQADRTQQKAVLERFAGWLQPLISQFALASVVIDQYAALGGGSFQVLFNGRLIAVVNMRGDVGVLPSAALLDFQDALWRRVSEPAEVPTGFVRTSLSQLMWQFAMRTRRDMLPPRYRTASLYFRRPPRLAHRLLKDSHLLLMRELASAPATLRELAKRTGMDETLAAHGLAALYLVGTITSNPKRAAARRDDDSLLSRPNPNSGEQMRVGTSLPRRPIAGADMTAPVPLNPY
ncbi:MAG: hypothetical protein V4864_16725 [Pseudomonadota bacterium]